MATRKQPAPLKDSMVEWAASQDRTAVNRLVKRIRRFGGNTTSPVTGVAAETLADLIENSLEEVSPMGETDEDE